MLRRRAYLLDYIKDRRFDSQEENRELRCLNDELTRRGYRRGYIFV
jgi:hypothetical protein